MTITTSDYLLAIKPPADSYDNVLSLLTEQPCFDLKAKETTSGAFYLTVHMDTEDTDMHFGELGPNIVMYANRAKAISGDEVEVTTVSDYSFH